MTCSEMGCCGEDRGGCSKLDLLSWLWVVMGEAGLLTPCPWDWGEDVGSGTTSVSAPTLSLHKSGSADFFALFLWGREYHTVLCFIMEKKIKFIAL